MDLKEKPFQCHVKDSINNIENHNNNTATIIYKKLGLSFAMLRGN